MILIRWNLFYINIINELSKLESAYMKLFIYLSWILNQVQDDKHRGFKLNTISGVSSCRKNGSALLLVVTLTSITLIGTYVLWRSASTSFEGAMFRYKAKRQFYVTESLVLYGVALIKQRLIDLSKIKPNKSILIYQGSWPKGKLTIGKLYLNYNPKNKRVDLQANLFDDSQLEPIAITTLVCKEDKGEFKILSWNS